MRKLFFSLFLVCISFVQYSSAQCDLDFTFANTGSNMTVFFTPPAASGMVDEMGEGTIGAFFLNDTDVYICAASGEITGAQMQIAVMGDDATTVDVQDGFNTNQEIFWFYLSNDGNVYSLALSPADVYSTNGMSFISSYTSTSIDCEDINTGSSSCDYNFDFINTGSNMTVFFTPPTAVAMAAEMGDGTIGAFFLNDANTYFCSGSVDFTGTAISVAVMGDDATTVDVQDGFNANQEMLWFYETNDGTVYSLALSPNDSYNTNGNIAITEFVATIVDCGSTSTVLGCTDVIACNYNELATEDDLSCTYPETNYDCNNNCLNDTDADGICDENEIVGCQEELADNYNAEATDEGPCNYEGCNDYNACNYNALVNVDNGTCLYTDGICESCEGGIIIDNDADNDGVCNDDELGVCTDELACNYNDDQTSLSDNTLCVFAIGCDNCSGETNGTGTVVNNDSDDDGICDSDEIEGCQDEMACNFNSSATDSDNSCEYPAENYNCQGECINDTDSDGVCDEDEVLGCTNESACNYDVNATENNGNCAFAMEYYSCDGDCFSDADGDLVCDQNEILGCTDEDATNYNEMATEEDGSCEYEVEECVLPNSFVVNTGTNMTLMLTPAFINSLNVSSEDAYIVATTNEGLVVGSAMVHESQLDGGQVATPLWADDATTEVVDGAIEGENINLQLVESSSLYTIELNITISFSANAISVQPIPVNPVFSCSGEVAAITGCTDETACNYNENATEDDNSCVFEVVGYDCNGTCYNDTDNDGVCDINEISGCTDATALNYNVLATDEDGSCEYPEPVEGCTDPEANNFNELANIDNGSCLYGIGGCTYSEASNYNSEATYEDESCIFDIPFIYVTSPIDGDLLTTSSVNFSYQVDNFLISSGESAGHIKYAVDGGSFGSLYNQDGVITQEFEYGEHSIQFILYDNVVGNNQPISPLVETTINFTVGDEGCTNPLAGNYNLNAIVDDGSCIPNAGVNFNNPNTGENHTLMVLFSQFGVIDVNGLLSQPGDLLGVFYENDGEYYGAGYNTITEGDIQIAAWGDDATTEEIDGFLTGQSFVWAIQYAETGNNVYLEAIYGSGTSAYTTNGLSSIIGFEIMELDEIAGCMDSAYVEFNPFAVIDDNSCETLKVYGCTDSLYLEYWDYDSTLFAIETPDVIANTNNGSCLTFVEEGCTMSEYLEYCSNCNVSNSSMCTNIEVLGCTDPLALNYDSLANSENGTCEYNLCINIEVANFEIITSNSLSIPVLAYDIINSSSEEVTLPTLTLNLDTNEYFEISTSIVPTTQINPGDTVHVEGIITNDISTLPDYIELSGYVLLEGTSFESGSVSCELAITEEFISTSHVGCSMPSAYNYDESTTVNDGSCIEYLQASVSLFNPTCYGQYGTASIFIIGGVAPYSSPSIYTQYSELNIPQIVQVEVDANGTIYMTGLADGNYSVEIHDSSDMIEIHEFTVVSPEEVLVEANINSSSLLTSNVVQGNAVFYQWLYEGETIPGANSSIHYGAEVGEYEVYIENENGCGAYSDPVFLNTVGIEDLALSSFNIYPNPVTSIANLYLSQLTNNTHIVITDILGHELFDFDLDTRVSSEIYKIDMTSLPNGMYFVVVENNSKKFVKRFVKN